MMYSEKPGVLERLGSALNSSDLSPDGERSRPVDLIGALGMLQINPDAGAHAAVDVAHVDPRTELGSVLVRLKYAGDRTLGERAVHLLVMWIRHQKAYSKWKLRPGGDSLVQRFARQGLAEWLFPVCPHCSGRAMIGLERGEVRERRVRCGRCKGRGSIAREKVRHVCPDCRGNRCVTMQHVSTKSPAQCLKCSGTGLRVAPDHERQLVLGLTDTVYRKHWLRRFQWLGAAFDRIDRLEKNCLQAQLKSG